MSIEKYNQVKMSILRILKENSFGEIEGVKFKRGATGLLELRPCAQMNMQLAWLPSSVESIARDISGGYVEYNGDWQEDVYSEEELKFMSEQ